ncbi:hypothetical protein MIND_01148900 [Mycena indigotica]|uniref:Uncharacterized protein n=1 Tax=Mycena indigotica TaxID=2126181 RepID=A0A8H6S6B5_9AGAR|nr:uncharacterized protein MIND_01148900 [Mycena indigotica]KAF7293689.1 hypothetical protein MIND_01148900 [Mycena indigotica]
MAPTHYTCERCPLNGGQNHRVPKLDRVLHQIDVKAQQARDAQAQPELTVDHLANLLTTVVTLDDGIDPRNQLHSKLFSSRDEVQATAPDIPLQYTPVSAADAFDSIQSLLPPKLTLHTMARQTRHENEALLKDTLQRIHAAHRDLDMHHALNDDIRDLRRSLEMATSTVLQAGRLLASIKPPSKAKTGFSVQENEAFKSLLQMVKDEARLLDSLIDVVGRLVPKSVVKDEVQYDSGISPLPKPHWRLRYGGASYDYLGCNLPCYHWN